LTSTIASPRAVFPCVGALLLLGTAALAPAAAQSTGRPAPAPARAVSFQRDIRPLLSNICSACHGPDEKARKAGLRLDTRDGVLKTIVSRKPDRSPLFLRLKLTGAGQMPPPGFLRRPTAQQIELVGEWIAQGGKWEQPWAYAPIAHPAPPPVRASAWPKNEIDRFILARLQREGLAPAPAAGRRTLLRRLSFDLAGLPPTYGDVQSFLADKSPDAYEKQVDRLLASERFGERLAVYWLDLVRYADTRGYHGDQHQEVSPYRDYVIQSFNRNKPFDVFTREQIAGDLLPQAGDEQKIASGYNKLLMTTEEGGAQAKEYMAKYAADRVRNVSAVWLGSTMGCCQCHDHKYDPFTAKDFYSMAAFFADVKQTAVGGLDVTAFPTAEQSARIAALTRSLSTVQQRLDTQTPALDAAQSDWERSAAGALKKPEPISAILSIEPAKRSDKQRQEIAAYYRSIAPALAADRAERARFQGELDALNAQVRKTMITTAVEPAVMRVLPRGNWQDESGPIVTPEIPAFLGQLSEGDRRATRLDLANWLTSPRNPLTARVMANRMWALLFGHGISRSLEDFGAQGAPPSHPQLLDWLASEYRDHGWDTKRLIRLIVMSAAYRQSSIPTPALAKADPGNVLFGRQGRQRLDAEFVRDNALAASGLLVNRLGGPSVKPYQPAHYWDYLNFPVRTWSADRGDDLYRRGLYGYWCRTYLQPSLLAFDAPTREECCSGRVVSNTPQQALVLLNDETYVEAARALAERVLRDGGPSPAGRIQAAYHAALQRDPSPREAATLLRVYSRQEAEYVADPAAAAELLRVGDHPTASGIAPQELAAWMSVTRVIMNLHEFITRN
jgi:mono/diheme cytochrome c family protein